MASVAPAETAAAATILRALALAVPAFQRSASSTEQMPLLPPTFDHHRPQPPPALVCVTPLPSSEAAIPSRIFESCSSSKGVSVAVVDANAIVHGDKLASRSRLPPEALPLVLQSTPRRQQRHSSPPTPAVHRAPFARRRRTPLTPLSRDAVAAPVAAGHRRRPWTPLPPIEESSLLRFNTCRAKGGASGFKVAILGAAGGIGQPLALLMKMNTGAVHYGVDIGRKKKQQPAAAATKKEGEAEETTRESRKTKEDYYSAMRWKKDEEREAQECLMEEEAMARKAKEEEAAAQDFEKWKGEFSVDAEGTTENDIQDGSQDLLSDFVEYIKKQKCIPLEDLAAEFKLRTQECINRIISLESMGRLSGVMDDRGKYIYISPEEMKAVADYIKREGRVSISHLASQSNQFIDLEPKPQFVEGTGNADGIAVA